MGTVRFVAKLSIACAAVIRRASLSFSRGKPRILPSGFHNSRALTLMMGCVSLSRMDRSTPVRTLCIESRANCRGGGVLHGCTACLAPGGARGESTHGSQPAGTAWERHANTVRARQATIMWRIIVNERLLAVNHGRDETACRDGFRCQVSVHRKQRQPAESHRPRDTRRREHVPPVREILPSRACGTPHP